MHSIQAYSDANARPSLLKYSYQSATTLQMLGITTSNATTIITTTTSAKGAINSYLGIG